MWFQSNEIKNDTNYYNLVISLIKILFKNLKNKKDFELKKIANEIAEAIKKTEYTGIYEATRKLFFKIDPTEIDYHVILYSLNFLGFKKESPINEYFIYNLKDIKEYEVLSNSPYTKEIDNFNYDIIDEEFLQSFNIFIDYIMQEQPDEETINEILKKLKAPDRNTQKKINIKDIAFITFQDNTFIESDNDFKNSKNQYDSPTKVDIDKDIKSIIQDNGLINSQDNCPIKSNIDSRNNKNKDNNSKSAQTDLNQNIIQENAFIHFPAKSPIKNDSNSYINQNNDSSIKNIDGDINPKNIQDSGIKKEDTDINLNKIQTMEVVIHKDNYDVNLNYIKDNNQKKNNNEGLNIIHINSPIKSNANMISIQDNEYNQVINLKEDSNEKLKIIQSNIQNEYDDNNLDNYQSKNSFKEEAYDKSISCSNDIEVNNININLNNIQKDFGKKEKSFKNEYNGKKNNLIKNEKNKKINSTQINSNIEEETSNNEETEITKDKKIELEIDNDSYEKFITKNKFQYEENLSLDKAIKIIPKRLYRVYGIIQVKSKIKQLMS